MSEGLRQCPRCATLIKAGSAACRHCGAELEAPATSTSTGLIVWVAVILVILTIAVIGVVLYS